MTFIITTPFETRKNMASGGGGGGLGGGIQTTLRTFKTEDRRTCGIYF